MVPDGDRRHGAVSRDVIYEVMRWRDGNHHIVRVLILRHNLFRLPNGLLSQPPFQHVAQRGLVLDDRGQAVPFRRVEVREVDQRYWH